MLASAVELGWFPLHIKVFVGVLTKIIVKKKIAFWFKRGPK